MPYFNFREQKIFYREKGEGELLLILPGNRAASIFHEGEIDHFSQNYRCVSLDFLGTGRSARTNKWDTDWWYEGACQAAVLVKHLNYENCYVMGTSGGSMAALLMAIHFPEIVDCVICDSCVESFSPEQLRKEVEGRKKADANLIAFWNAAHGHDWQDVIENDNSLLLKLAEAGGNVTEGRLNEIKCPVLFTASLTDSFLPEPGKQICSMAEQVKDARVYFSNKGDHPFMWENPDEFRFVADWFLGKLKG